MQVKTLVVGPLQMNCYIVSDDHQQCIIIDPGAEPHTIINYIHNQGLKVGALVCTHRHWDHVGALKEVSQEFKLGYCIGQHDAHILTHPSLECLSMGARPLPQAVRLLRDGDKVEQGALSFSVIDTPGHTVGGICLCGHGVCFTGDTLFCGSMGRTDFESGNEAELLRSLARLSQLDDQTIVYPGHGSATTIAQERATNPYMQYACTQFNEERLW